MALQMMLEIRMGTRTRLNTARTDIEGALPQLQEHFSSGAQSSCQRAMADSSYEAHYCDTNVYISVYAKPQPFVSSEYPKAQLMCVAGRHSFACEDCIVSC